MYIQRNIPLLDTLRRKSVILLGPRRTGKSTMIREQVQADQTYNLLEADTFRRLSYQPESIRKSLTDQTKLVVIDEIQKLPSLMDEVHLMIEQFKIKFLLTGSSSRKLYKSHTGLMAGRATRLYMHPFNSQELGQANLDTLLLWGSLPGIHFAKTQEHELKDYVGMYLKEEILSEALVRRIENFSRFLEAAAHTNGQVLNFERIASDAQVPARTVREYYHLLEDTLFGKMVEPVKSTKKRKSISKAKFYFFDLGVVSGLLGRKQLISKTVEYGQTFEHFIFLEMDCYRDYFSQESEIGFWQDYQEGEIDFIINDEIAVEVKSSEKLRREDLKSMQKFMAKGRLKRHIIVTNSKERTSIEGIEVIPWQDFLQELWAQQIF